MADMLPKLFFVHFRETSFVVEKGGIVIGFSTEPISHTDEGILVMKDYDGDGEDRVLFCKLLSA